jgi:hypothetical protein
MTRIIKDVFFALVLGVLARPLCAQQTYTAASCSLADVQAAINQELARPADGDIISIPSGTCTWSGTKMVSASFTTSVTVQGAGAVSSTTGGAGTTGSDQTVIIDNINHSSGSASSLELSTKSGKVLRVTGIALLMNGSSSATNNGVLAISGSSNSVRVDHCHFYTNGGSTILSLLGSVTGVADHNYFDSPSGSLTTTIGFYNGTNWNGDSVGHGDKSWADTDHWGTSQFIFIEDCRFHNGDIGDSNSGAARYVLRYNTVTADIATAQEGQMYNHGLTSARGRSTRAAEVYKNSFIMPGPTGANHPPYSLNGGTLLFWGNTITQYRQGITLDYTRKNNNTYPYGSTPTGWGNCDSSAGVVTAWDGPSSGYPCMDAGGRGAGDLVTGGDAISSVVNTTTGTISWAHQALSPIYIWGINYTPAGGGGTLVANQYGGYAENRDFYQSTGNFNGTVGIGSGLFSARPGSCTAGPGGNTPGVGYWATDQNTLYVCTATNTWTSYYTPYAYPHPLTLGTQGTSAPAPPTNLVTTVH